MVKHMYLSETLATFLLVNNQGHPVGMVSILKVAQVAYLIGPASCDVGPQPITMQAASQILGTFKQ